MERYKVTCRIETEAWIKTIECREMTIKDGAYCFWTGEYGNTNIIENNGLFTWSCNGSEDSQTNNAGSSVNCSANKKEGDLICSVLFSEMSGYSYKSAALAQIEFTLKDNSKFSFGSFLLEELLIFLLEELPIFLLGIEFNLIFLFEVFFAGILPLSSSSPKLIFLGELVIPAANPSFSIPKFAN